MRAARSSSPPTAAGNRKGAAVPLKRNADEAIARTSSVEHCVVVRRTGGDFQRLGRRPRPPVSRSRRGPGDDRRPGADGLEDLLYLLYTKHDGEAEGDHAHHRWLPRRRVRDPSIHLRPPPRERRVFPRHGRHRLGHRPLASIVYGPLANGATGVIYEGAIDFPDKDRWAQIASKYRATILYTAPTAIRALMKYGHEEFAGDDLSLLRLLGSVGEPINPEAWAWYWKYIGGERCPVVDTWWQTETGMIMITPALRHHDPRFGSATFPFPGVKADVVDEAGNSVPLGLAAIRLRRAAAGDAARHLRGPGSLPADVLGRATRAGTSPATGASATTRAITGSSDAWTMS